MVPTTLRATHFDPFTSTLLDSVEDGIVVYDAEFRYMVFNRFMERLTGVRASDALGKVAFELFPHLRETGIDVLLERALEGETVRSPDTEYEVPSTGRRGWVVGQYSPVIGADGERVGVVGIVRDITHRKRIEEALRRSELWFRSIIENASEMVTVLDATGRTTYASPASNRMLGLPPEELIGRHAFELVHDDDRALVEHEFARLRERRGASMPIEFRCRHRDGGYRTVVATARNLLDDPAVGGIVINSRDVTEQRSLELQFQHSQKMEAVGRLAGGVAHDFNNLLGVIQGNAELALQEVEEPAPGFRELQEIQQAAVRAAVLTRQLLAFSRQQPLTMELLDPNVVIAGISRLLERAVGETITLELRLDPSAGPVKVDRGQLEQVLMNLVTNARDAMPSGGMVTIASSIVSGSVVARFQPATNVSGQFVLLSVRDSGVGMPREIQARVFEPFFTTKGRDKGTGLGLSTAYGIVQQFGGFIVCDSELGRGTTFRIFLPRVG